MYVLTRNSEPTGCAEAWGAGTTRSAVKRGSDVRRTFSSLYAAGVTAAHVVDPTARVLEALERTDAGWTRLGAWTDGDVARVRPFDAVELTVSRLFPPETAAELASRLAEEAFRYDVAR